MVTSVNADYNAPKGAATIGSSGTPADTVVTETSYGQSSSAGISDLFSRGDHTHGTPAVNSASIFQKYNDANEFIGFADVNGVRLRIPFELAASATPRLICNWNSATYSQTLTTVTVTQTGHLMSARLNGANVYLTVSTGNLTNGWYTNFTYVDANTFTCTSTVSQSTSGNLAANTAQITMAQHLIPAGAIGASGHVRLFFSITTSGLTSAVLDFYLANTNFWTNSITTTSTHGSYLAGFSNQNNEAIQSSMTISFSGGLGLTTEAKPKGTVDTSVSQVLTVKATLATAGNYIAVWPNRAEIHPGD